MRIRRLRAKPHLAESSHGATSAEGADSMESEAATAAAGAAAAAGPDPAPAAYAAAPWMMSGGGGLNGLGDSDTALDPLVKSPSDGQETELADEADETGWLRGEVGGGTYDDDDDG